MAIKRALRLLIDNFYNVFKLLLYRLVMGALFVGLSYFILDLGLRSLLEGPEVEHVLTMVGEFFEALVSGKTAYLESFRGNFVEALKALFTAFTADLGSIIGSFAGVVVLYLVFRFLNGMATFGMMSISYDRLSTFGKTSFSAAFFENLGRAVRYHLLYVPLSFVYDVLALVLCWFFFFYTPSLLGDTSVLTVFLGLSLTVAVYIVLQAVKLTFISSWMPYAVENKKVLAGLRDSFTLKGKFLRRFVSYLIAIYLMVVINVVCGFCTLGSFLLITLPASAIYLLWLQLVLYYHENGRKYYLHARKVVGDAEDMPVESEIDLDLES